MSITLGQNISALRAHRRLNEATASVGKNFQRLSSGLRINSAADDAAGLAIASQLNSNSRLYAQGIRNLNDGVSILSIADATLQELTNITTRQRELAQQSANETYTDSQRVAMNKEAEALSSEFNRIIGSTEFNGTRIFKEDPTATSIQTAPGALGILSFTIGSNSSRTVGDGTFATEVTYTAGPGSTPSSLNTADLDGDGHLDLFGAALSADQIAIYFGNGDGTFGSVTNIATGDETRDVQAADLNGDGELDLISADYGDDVVSVHLGNGDGTFQARTSYSMGNGPYAIKLADLNDDGKLDMFTPDAADDTISIRLGNGDGTFGTRTTIATQDRPSDVNSADFNGDGALDLFSADYNAGRVTVALGNGDGTFAAGVSYAVGTNPRRVISIDADRDGHADILSADANGGTLSVLLGRGDGTFQAQSTLAAAGNPYAIAAGDLNGDGLTDLVTGRYLLGGVRLLTGNSSGSFDSGTVYSGGLGNADITLGDFNEDGALDIASANYTDDNIGVFIANTTRTSQTRYFDLLTADNARSAMTELDTTLQRLSSERGAIGAYQSRFEVAHEHLQSLRTNSLEAAHRITDADIADEVAQMVTGQVRQQAATSVLAQANQQPSLVLRLLGRRP